MTGPGQTGGGKCRLRSAPSDWHRCWQLVTHRAHDSTHTDRVIHVDNAFREDLSPQSTFVHQPLKDLLEAILGQVITRLAQTNPTQLNIPHPKGFTNQRIQIHSQADEVASSQPGGEQQPRRPLEIFDMLFLDKGYFVVGLRRLWRESADPSEVTITLQTSPGPR